MTSKAHVEGRGRDLAIMTLEIAEAGGNTVTISSVLCPKEQFAKPLELCLPCEDSLGPGRDPAAREGYVGCAGDAPVRPAPAREASDPEPSIADRTPISAVMSRNVLALRAGVRLDRARDLLLARGLGGAPVVDSEARPVGMLSIADLLRAGAEGLGAEATAADAMNRQALTLPDTAPLSEVAALLAFEQAHRAAVVSREGRVVGTVTASDLLRWLAQQDEHLLPSGHSLKGR